MTIAHSPSAYAPDSPSPMTPVAAIEEEVWSETAPTPQRAGSAFDEKDPRTGDETDVDAALDARAPKDEEAAPAAPNLPAGGGHGPPHMGQPDGGLTAWLQVASAFAVFFNTWGVLNTFGNFQTYYESGALFVESSSNISWIGSIQAFCVLMLGLVSGPIYDRGYLREQLTAGSFLIVFGFMMLSICKTYWQALLAQGFCIGIGAGLIFTPAIAILPTYFHKRLGLAMGLSASGSSLGGIIYPIMMYKLINQVGFGWGVRIIGFVALATLMVPVLCMRMRVKPAHVRHVIDWTVFSDWPFLFFIFALMIGFTGLYVMLFYLSYDGLARGITDANMAFYLVPILNAASMFGRTVPNWISDYTGPMNLFGPAALVCGVLVFCMLAVKSIASIIVVAVFYGFFSGVFVAMPPVAFVRLTADKSKIGTRFGMGFATCAFGVLLGGPASGAILGTNDADLHWTAVWCWGGAVGIASGIMLVGLRFYLTKGKLVRKI